LKKYALWCLAFALIAIIFYGTLGLFRAIRFSKTNETLELLLLTAKNYNGKIIDLQNHSFLIEEIHRNHPNIPYLNGELLDAWGNPIAISAQASDGMFYINVVSSGPDGIHGSKDDITKDDKFKMEK